MLQIFHMAARQSVGYDSYDSFVVVAGSESEARTIAAECAGDEGEELWLDGQFSSCTAIGTPHADLEVGVVVSSFNAG